MPFMLNGEILKTSSYRQRLLSELSHRQSRNPKYSLRSFARDLKISPTALSQVLSSKRNLSKSNLAKVMTYLKFTPTERERALKEISTYDSVFTDDHFTTLEEDTFQVMSDWYYFALLSLASQMKVPANLDWLARKFDITRPQAADALERLVRLGLIEIHDNYIVYDGRPLKTTTDIPSRSARYLQHQHIQLAQKSLDRDPIHERDMTSITMAIDKAKIPKAKEMIKSFRRRLCRYLESNNKGDDVYVMSMQLFPVTHEVNND